MLGRRPSHAQQKVLRVGFTVQPLRMSLTFNLDAKSWLRITTSFDTMQFWRTMILQDLTRTGSYWGGATLLCANYAFCFGMFLYLHLEVIVNRVDAWIFSETVHSIIASFTLPSYFARLRLPGLQGSYCAQDELPLGWYSWREEYEKTITRLWCKAA